MDRRSFLKGTAGALAVGAQLSTSAQQPAKTPWKYGKKWVYSITYDEGPEELLKYALPIHRKHGVPGHVAFVSSQVGIPRNVPGSSYHDMMILSKKQMQNLADEGWGVSCHSMNHIGVSFENGGEEVVKARKTLSDSVGMPVNMFTVPGSNHAHPPSIEFAPKAGFNSIMTIYDRVNTRDTDLMWLGRSPLHTEYPGPFYSAFDPYKRLMQARELGGWIIDYCHSPRPDKAVHPAKDCTTQELDQRFAAVKEFGGDDVWLAEPNEVVDFLLNDPESQRLRASAPPAIDSLHDESMRALYEQKEDEA